MLQGSGGLLDDMRPRLPVVLLEAALCSRRYRRMEVLEGEAETVRIVPTQQRCDSHDTREHLRRQLRRRAHRGDGPPQHRRDGRRRRLRIGKQRSSSAPLRRVIRRGRVACSGDLLHFSHAVPRGLATFQSTMNRYFEGNDVCDRWVGGVAVVRKPKCELVSYHLLCAPITQCTSV